MELQEMIEYIRSQGYRVYKNGPREGSSRYIREKKEGPKPKWNTFQSRYKRRGGYINHTEELINYCFAII